MIQDIDKKSVLVKNTNNKVTSRVEIGGETLKKVNEYGKLLIKGIEAGIENKQIELGEKGNKLYNLFKDNEKELGEFANKYKNIFKGNSDPKQLAAALPGLVGPILENFQEKYGENEISKEDGFEGLKELLGKMVGDDEVEEVEALLKDPSKILKDPKKTKTLLKSALDNMKGMKFNEAGDLIGETFLGNTDKITQMIDQLAEASPYLNKLWRIGTYVIVGLMAITIVVLGIFLETGKDKALGIVGTLGGGLLADAILAIIDAIIYKKSVIAEQKVDAKQKAFSETRPAMERFVEENKGSDKKMELDEVVLETN